MHLKPNIEEQAISFAVHHVYEREIEKINILNASIEAMHQSISKLNPNPEFIIVDGNKFKNPDFSYKIGRIPCAANVHIFIFAIGFFVMH